MLAYWLRAFEADAEMHDIDRIPNFDAMRRMVVDLAGRQHHIDLRFDFTRILLEALQIPVKLATPNLGGLASAWASVSEICHIRWVVERGAQPGVDASDVCAMLSELCGQLDGYQDALGWVDVGGDSLSELCSQFMRRELDEDGVRASIALKGAHAVWVAPDGSKTFIGTSIDSSSERTN